MKKIFLLLICFFALPVFAICPVCTVAVGVGVGVAHWLGIDDSIIGLWIGGMIVSLIFWTLTWLDKKQIDFFAKNMLVASGYYISVIFPLYWQGIIGSPINKLWGIDKILLGIIIGSSVFYLGYLAYLYGKKINQGKVYFPFQKVVFPITPLIFISYLFYFITRG